MVLRATDAAITPDELIARTGIAMPALRGKHRNYSAGARTRQVVGNVVGKLAKAKEVRVRADGTIEALAKLRRAEPANNGTDEAARNAAEGGA